MSRPEPLTRELLRTMPLPWPGEGGKEERGRVLVVAGSSEIPGAALLTGTAALRAGAGKLQVATAESVARFLGLGLPEARVVGLPETSRGGVRHEDCTSLADLAGRCDAMVLGPGMHEEPELRDVLSHALDAGRQAAVVLDAAALALAHELVPQLSPLAGRLVLTPHAGEMARLLGADAAAVVDDPLAAAREAASRLRAVVVMKGAETDVVTPDGRAWHFTGGHPGLGTSGSGDVLAGVIGGLLARGATPVQATLWGVFAHGEAGQKLAARVGPLGFLARELLPELPTVLHGVTAGFP